MCVRTCKLHFLKEIQLKYLQISELMKVWKFTGLTALDKSSVHHGHLDFT